MDIPLFIIDLKSGVHVELLANGAYRTNCPDDVVLRNDIDLVTGALVSSTRLPWYEYSINLGEIWVVIFTDKSAESNNPDVTVIDALTGYVLPVECRMEKSDTIVSGQLLYPA